MLLIHVVPPSSQLPPCLPPISLSHHSLPAFLLSPSLTIPSLPNPSLPPSFPQCTLTHAILSQNHTDECVFRTVKCPNEECEVVLPFNQLESHQQTCQFRRVTCEHCNTETSVSQQEVTELIYVFTSLPINGSLPEGNGTNVGSFLHFRFPYKIIVHI